MIDEDEIVLRDGVRLRAPAIAKDVGRQRAVRRDDDGDGRSNRAERRTQTFVIASAIAVATEDASERAAAATSASCSAGFVIIVTIERRTIAVRCSGSSARSGRRGAAVHRCASPRSRGGGRPSTCTRGPACSCASSGGRGGIFRRIAIGKDARRGGSAGAGTRSRSRESLRVLHVGERTRELGCEPRAVVDEEVFDEDRVLRVDDEIVERGPISAPSTSGPFTTRFGRVSMSDGVIRRCGRRTASRTSR